MSETKQDQGQDVEVDEAVEGELKQQQSWRKAR